MRIYVVGSRSVSLLVSRCLARVQVIVSRFGSREKIRCYDSICREFMKRVLGVSSGVFVFTDESLLDDFVLHIVLASKGRDSHQDVRNTLRRRIYDVYGVDVATLPDDRLVTVFGAILQKRGF